MNMQKHNEVFESQIEIRLHYELIIIQITA